MADQPQTRRRKTLKNTLRALTPGRRNREGKQEGRIAPTPPGSAPPLITTFGFNNNRSNQRAVSPVSTTGPRHADSFPRDRRTDTFSTFNYSEGGSYGGTYDMTTGSTDANLFAQATSGFQESRSAVVSPSMAQSPFEREAWESLEVHNPNNQRSRSYDYSALTYASQEPAHPTQPSVSAASQQISQPSTRSNTPVQTLDDNSPAHSIQVTPPGPIPQIETPLRSQRPGLAPRQFSYQPGPEMITARGRSPSDVLHSNYLFAEASLGLPPEIETGEDDDLPDYAESQREAAAKTRRQALIRAAELERQWNEARARRRD